MVTSLTMPTEVEATENTVQDNAVEVRTAYQIYDESESQREGKMKSFVKDSQDGNNILIKHIIEFSLIELLDVTNLGLKFPSSNVIIEQNEKILEKAQAKVLGAVAEFLNNWQSESNITCESLDYKAGRINSPVFVEADTEAETSAIGQQPCHCEQSEAIQEDTQCEETTAVASENGTLQTEPEAVPYSDCVVEPEASQTEEPSAEPAEDTIPW